MRATYRLMFNEGFRFAQARALLPYLRDLGVSHVYLPPSFQARAGSAHGYDVVDPNRISAELGGEEEFRALCGDAHAMGLGVVLDIVPNHMATDDANRYWTEERARYFDVDEETGVYRRFFDIDHLAGVRMEDPEVFDETHRLTLALVRERVVDGLRIDHPDGLADPKGYLDRLGVDDVWVEKILGPGERLRADWPVAGTVGYEFLVDVGALFVDPAAEAPLTDLWHEVSGDTRPFADWATEAKLEQARGPFQRDVDRLLKLATPPADIHAALAALPVYRTYARTKGTVPFVRGGTEGTVPFVHGGAEGAVPERGWTEGTVPFVRGGTEGTVPFFSVEDRAVVEAAGIGWLLEMPAAFVTRFQQTTPPVMAKGVEDTAFYRYARLVALNDVGGDPSRFGIDAEAFHRANLERPPRNLLITSTHDTKRSGDARARAGAIATIPGEWREFALARIDERFPVESYFVLQNLCAVGRVSDDRIDTFVEKSLREMKRRSTWAEPDVEHEAQVKAWAKAVDVEPMATRLAQIGDRHALAQVLLKLTCPGVPDIYHGDEVLDLSLVDPDNRRAIDWERVRRGDAKTALIRALLAAGIGGDYEPLQAGEGVVAFRRGSGHHVAVAVRDGAALPPLPGDVVYAGDGMRVTSG